MIVGEIVTLGVIWTMPGLWFDAAPAARPREGRRFNPRANPLVPGANGRRERERRLRQMARMQARRAKGGAA